MQRTHFHNSEMRQGNRYIHSRTQVFNEEKEKIMINYSQKSSSATKSSIMGNTNHKINPHTRSKMKTYESSFRYHRCRVPLLMVAVLVAFELLLFTKMSQGANAKSFVINWNLSSPIFRIDNNDHVIDVNKGNTKFEFDQVHIICPFYEPGTNENETEKYIIYNVSKVEYETCRITNPNPRIIAICDKPFNTTLVTISFRPFTPQPGGLEFKPGNDYYFISTSSKDDLHRRIGGHCSSGNTKVIFKVFGEGDAIKTTTEPSPPINNDSGKTPPRIDTWPNNAWKNHHNDDAGSSSDSTNSESDLSFRHNESSNKNFNINNSNGYPSTQRPIYVNRDNHNNINTNINNNMSGGNNVNKPTKKTNEYDSRQNEVVKNEELTYNNRSTRLPASTLSIVLSSSLIISIWRFSNISKFYHAFVSMR